VIRITHVSLPPGLSALAQRGPDGELSVYVSDTLPPERQRAAVRVALRASRRSGWRDAMLPVPSLGLLIAAGLRGAGRVLRLHWAAFGTAATVAAATAAAVYIAAAPHGHQPATAARPPAPATSQPAVPAHGTAPRPGRSRPATGPPKAGPRTAPRALATVAARPTPASKAPSPPASSAPAPPSTSPSPRPRPSPTPHQSRHCVKILGIRVCVGVGA
jgi:hypothetical protein